MIKRMSWSYWSLTAAALMVVGVGVVPAAAAADPGGRAAAVTSGATTAVPVNYQCFVTFPGGETTVPFTLTFTSTAPAQVAPYRLFAVTLDSQEWTPDPVFNLEIRDITVKYKLPDNAWFLTHELSGGRNIGATPPKVRVDTTSRTFILRVAGPLPASVPFDLPTVTVYLLSGPGGVAQTATGGTSLTDPSWSWVRTDLEGVQRPFDCNPDTPVVFSSTTIG